MLTFEVLIQECFNEINTNKDLSPVDNKYLFSLINDFEDGKWRSSKFHQFIWNNVAQTALSAEERNSLIDKSDTLLIKSAQNLRLTDKDKEEVDNIGRGSELAEICLYGIMKEYYKALPVVPKIFHKQNVNDNAKGADSVHIVVTDSDYTLWFGEAKFYNSLEDTRFDTIIKSVENALITEKLKKENSIITDLKDIDTLIENSELVERIKGDLNYSNSIDKLKPKIHIPILIIYECNKTQKQSSLTEEYKQEIIQYHENRAQSYFEKQISKLKESIVSYDKITFHLILFPVPNKKDIVDRFVAKVESRKEDAQNG